MPKLVVWTHDADPGDPAFDRLKASVTTFIAGDQGVSLRHGYLLDVYGPDGRLLHRLDARM
ncbi:hypothetical protein [Streptantibioticus silvisoli]|uniref:Uncharacterized protein n=1 Tax=Streptantibioticus silvisoli TaxID=2705255 RepID=A0ABT6W9K5_9ACTN|nr:hypothetical protein [Streptantibioticus silvisoli]MDI5967447.1 hypothetical protein [Streptantibioticus silvisoli]